MKNIYYTFLTNLFYLHLYYKLVKYNLFWCEINVLIGDSMKLVKKLLVVCFFGFLPAAVLAAHHKQHRHHHKSSHSSDHQATILNNQVINAFSPLGNEKNFNNTLPIVSDIPPVTKPPLPKPWLKNSDIQKILAKAQHNGQLPYVMSTLEKMQLPKSLALIPVMESQYKNVAKSNKGAGGIWQLMPATARELGIKSKDRFTLKSSTDAALKYFKKLHRKFGNWELAIAAYNAGDGRVKQALYRNPNARNVQELRLPQETKQYVLRFYALQNYISSARGLKA